MYRSGGLQQRTLNESCFHVINIISFPVFGGCISNRGALWASARLELMYAFMEKSVSMYVICRRRNYTASHLVFYGQFKKPCKQEEKQAERKEKSSPSGVLRPKGDDRNFEKLDGWRIRGLEVIRQL